MARRVRGKPVVGAPIATPVLAVTPHPSDRWKTADEWKMLAECGPGDTELFFSKDPVEKRAALAICADCPVARECLAEAMSQERGVDLHGRYGIRGGTTPVERRELARTWKERRVKPG
ncbi:MAG: WhiB family transcriptional regulator [Micrococcus sp.]|nr:WhiB family transcriptional regulator [Micrococcus sp.]